jgi:hypothetical protein
MSSRHETIVPFTRKGGVLQQLVLHRGDALPFRFIPFRHLSIARLSAAQFINPRAALQPTPQIRPNSRIP